MDQIKENSPFKEKATPSAFGQEGMHSQALATLTPPPFQLKVSPATHLVENEGGMTQRTPIPQFHKAPSAVYQFQHTGEGETSPSTETETGPTEGEGAAAEEGIDATVETELEAFLSRFANIPVTVRWVEYTETQCVEQSEIVLVHPPYFMNSRRAPASARRVDRAEANRRGARGETDALLDQISLPVRRGGMGMRRALVGKSTPEDLQAILQEAADRQLIQSGEGRNRPDSDDIRQWMVRYGIGIDCSGFVSQALNQIMTRLYGRPLESSETLNLGSGQLRGGARGFDRITDPAELRPGDTMQIPGHIRIIMGVTQTEEGTQFVTGESHAGGADIGIERSTWRYANDRLEHQTEDGSWERSRERPTFGRYQRLTAPAEAE